MNRTACALSLLLCLLAGACGGKKGTVAGTYVLDQRAMEDEWIEGTERAIEKAIAEAPPKDRRRMEARRNRRMARSLDEFRGLALTMVLEEDGTWRATGSRGGNPVEASGTWERDATDPARITFVQTVLNGREEDPPEVKIGAYHRGEIRVRPAPDLPADLVLRRK